MMNSLVAVLMLDEDSIVWAFLRPGLVAYLSALLRRHAVFFLPAPHRTGVIMYRLGRMSAGTENVDLDINAET